MGSCECGAVQHLRHLFSVAGLLPVAEGCGDPLTGGWDSAPLKAAVPLGCHWLWHKVRAWAFCENRNSGAGELGLGSSFQSRKRPYYLLLNLVLTAEASPR